MLAQEAKRKAEAAAAEAEAKAAERKRAGSLRWSPFEPRDHVLL